MDKLLAAQRKQFAGGSLGLPRITERISDPMPNLIPLSAVDSWAIYTEIGERLRNVLRVDHSKLPAHIEDRLNRLRELDGEPSPSSVPPMNTRWFE
jgi:hypothetical protein